MWHGVNSNDWNVFERAIHHTDVTYYTLIAEPSQAKLSVGFGR